MRTVNRGTILWFGKYMGKNVQTVLETNPGYLKWCVKNEIFTLKTGIQEEVEAEIKKNNSYRDSAYRYYDDSWDSPWDTFHDELGS